ncbi:hypothetical protein [Nonomuraea sediminis]|uniref:hypothetical protein n=1 Tax=Nonomuraea sediminis TaxID=2835864 RepID=UPI001BDD1A57|nr:hypothetical protein [Nonomuraea sediminis]
MEEGTTRRGLFGGAFANRSPLPPPDAPVAVLASVSGQDVTVRGYGRSAGLAPVAAKAEELPYGWALRPGDLVVLDESTPGTRTAVALHRNVTGSVEEVAADHITVNGTRCGLDPRTLYYEGQAPEPSARSASDPVRTGDTVVLECLDNRNDGTLTVHFMRRIGKA